MPDYRARVIDETIERSLNTFGAVIIEGPRAAGKTTTALNHAASSIRMDASPDTVVLAETQPSIVLAGATPRLIDEWQLAPTIWNAARYEVDTRQATGQFILTGSATPPDDITRHSGAGRFRRLTLRPMTLAESGDSSETVPFSDLFTGENGVVGGTGGPSVEDYAQLLVRGGWPALVSAPNRSAIDYLSSYLDDIARTDIVANGQHLDPQRMKALIAAIARNVATETAAAALAREAELDIPRASTGESQAALSAQTARRYLDALTRVRVLEEQAAWRPHLRSTIRVRVHPKWHFVDPSLATAALGASAKSLLSDLNTLGLLFESLAIRDLRVYADTISGVVSHYRDEQGHEVDAIVELRNGDWAAFEIKLGGQANINTASNNLKKLAEKVTEERRGRLKSLNVVTAGNTSITRPDGVNVIALGHLATGSRPALPS